MNAGIAARLSGGLALLLLASLGCGDPGQDGDLRLTGWVSSPREDDLVRALLADEIAEIAELGVAYDPIQANYPEKIQLMLATNTAPDVFMLDAFLVPALASYGTLSSLSAVPSALSTSSLDLDDFEPALLKAFERDGQLYGLPKDYTTVALFYDPQAFEEVGLERPPETWQELEQWAERLSLDRDGDGQVDRYGLGIDPGLDFLLPFVWQNGGELIDVEGRLRPGDEAAHGAIAWLQEMQQSKIAVFAKDVGASWNMDAFGRGSIAMTTSGYFATSFLDATFPDRQYKVAPLPVGRRAATLAYVVGYVMPAQARDGQSDPAKARRLLELLTGPRAQTYWSQQGIGLPPRRSVAAAQIEPGSAASVFTESAKHARIWQFGANQRLVDELQTALQAIYLTGEPIDEALETAAARLRKLER